MPQRKVPRVVFQPATSQGMLRGINQLVNAVRPTLGPLPRVVAIERAFRDGTPELLDDGATIARRVVELPDPDADMGAMFIRHLLWRVHEQVGDGTATTAVLFESVFEQGLRYIVSGGNAMQLRRYLDEGVEIILEQLSNMAVPLEGEQKLSQLAESICHDRPLAAMLGEIFNIIGEYGRLEVRSGRGREMERQYVVGMYWDSRIMSRAMITDRIGQKAELENASILISDLEPEDPQEMVPVLEMAYEAGVSKLLILASNMSDSVSGLLVSASREPDKFQVIAAKTPGAAMIGRNAAMEDLAVLTGARPLIKSAGNSWASVKPNHLGQARRAWANRHHIGIVGGRGDPRALRTHIANLRISFDRATETEARRNLRERIGKLMGGAATLWIGGASQSEIESRKELAARTADALREAVREGVVPGGGVALLACRTALQERRDQSNDTDERAAYQILIRVMEAPTRAILNNSGHDASEVMAEMRMAGDGYGFDVRAEKIADMAEAGIWDAAAVLKAATHGAVSSAALALTTDVLVHHKKPSQASHP